MTVILHTQEYSRFKKLIGNRDLDPYHLKRLREAVTKDNQLHLHPILINAKYEVVDGQHRLEVAKQLKTDVFFIVDHNLKDTHLIESNLNQKSFSMKNFLDFFATKHRLHDYMLLQKYLKMAKLYPKALLTLVHGNVNKKLMDELKVGKFKLSENENHQETITKYITFCAYTKDKKIVPKNMFTNFYFTQAFRWLINTSGFDEMTFYNKLNQKWYDLKPQKGFDGWYKLLIDIYNHKNQHKLEPAFGTVEEK